MEAISCGIKIKLQLEMLHVCLPSNGARVAEAYEATKEVSSPRTATVAALATLFTVMACPIVALAFWEEHECFFRFIQRIRQKSNAGGASEESSLEQRTAEAAYQIASDVAQG